MSRNVWLAVGLVSALGLLIAGIVAFTSYYFGGPWPDPNLGVEDPLIAEWLQSDQVVIHRRLFKTPLDNEVMYLQQGELADGVCHWSSAVVGVHGETRVLRVLATNHGTCERLVSQGTRLN